MFCPNCGTPLIDKSNFCHICGNKYEEKKEEPAPEPEPEQGTDGTVLLAFFVILILALYFLKATGFIN